MSPLLLALPSPSWGFSPACSGGDGPGEADPARAPQGHEVSLWMSCWVWRTNIRANDGFAHTQRGRKPPLCSLCHPILSSHAAPLEGDHATNAHRHTVNGDPETGVFRHFGFFLQPNQPKTHSISHFALGTLRPIFFPQSGGLAGPFFFSVPHKMASRWTPPPRGPEAIAWR